MFRGNAAHTGVYSGPAPRQFHGVKWKFPTGNRIVASPVVYGDLIVAPTRERRAALVGLLALVGGRAALRRAARATRGRW